MELINEELIKFRLSKLNSEKGGDRTFEQLCEKIVSASDTSFQPSHGSDAGGDGGIDGWSVLGTSAKVKYAFSIDRKAKSKIANEINKTNWNRYSKILFFSNQDIDSKIQEDIHNKYPDCEIEFFDMENISKIILEHEDLQEFLNLPALLIEITKEKIQKKPQFSSDDIRRIKNEIPRKILKENIEGDGKPFCENLSVFLQNVSEFTILFGEAGFGKTESLKQIYVETLQNKYINLIPLYVALQNYTSGNLHTVIKDAFSFLSEKYFYNGVLFLFDGFDEMSENDRDTFIKELKSLLKSNASVKNKAIISSRTYIFESSKFIDFNPVYVHLKPIDDDDIRSHLKNEPILLEKVTNCKIYKEYKGNIFYDTKLIEFFRNSKKQSEKLENIVDLYDYIEQEELDRISRSNNDKDARDDFRSIALYMTLHQKGKVGEEKEEYKLIKNHLPDEQNEFQFSHRSIQEFMAAKKIASQNDLTVIKDIFFYDKKIVSYLSDTFSFLLNILCCNGREYSILENIVKSMLSTENGFEFINIEKNKIDENLNKIIFENAAEQLKCKDMTTGNFASKLADFGLRNAEENINFILKKIEAENHNGSPLSYTFLLQNIVLNDVSKISDEQQERIYNLFIVALKNNAEDANIDFAYHLFYTVDNLPIIKKHSDDFDFVFDTTLEFAINRDDFEGMLNCISRYVITSGKKLNAEQFFKLCNSATKKIYDDYVKADKAVKENKTVTFHLIFLFDFVSLAKEYFDSETANEQFVFDFVNLMSKSASYKGYCSRNNDLRNIGKIISKSFVKFFSADENACQEKYKELLGTILIKEPGLLARETVFDYICDFVDFNKGFSFFEYLASRDDFPLYGMSYNIFEYFKLRMDWKNCFDDFKNTFDVKEVAAKYEIYEFYTFRMLYENSEFYEFAKRHGVNQRIFDSVEKSKNMTKSFYEKDEIRESKSKEALHLIFNRDELLKSMNAFMDNLTGNKEEDSVIIANVFNSFYIDNSKYELPWYNDFVDWILWLLFKNDSRISRRHLLDMLDVSTWQFDWFRYVNMYMSQCGLGFNELSKNERNKVLDWCCLILNTYPLETATSQFNIFHGDLNYVLRNATFIQKNEDFKKQYATKLYGFIFSGCVSTTGCYTMDYSCFSLEYLENFISTKDIIEFIYKNIDSVRNDDVALAIYGYIASHKENTKSYQKNKFNIAYKNYLEANLDKKSVPAIARLAPDFDFSFSYVDKSKLQTSLRLNEKKTELEDTYASYFLVYAYRLLSNEDKEVYKSVLSKIFSANRKDKKFRAVAAGNYLHLDKDNAKIFNYYADYLLKEKDLEILPYDFDYNPVYTNNPRCLKRIKKLFESVFEKEIPERLHNGFYRISIRSIESFAEKADKKTYNKIKKFLNSRTGVAENWAKKILENVNEIYSRSNYEPYSLKEIERMR